MRLCCLKDKDTLDKLIILEEGNHATSHPHIVAICCETDADADDGVLGQYLCLKDSNCWKSQKATVHQNHI